MRITDRDFDAENFIKDIKGIQLEHPTGESWDKLVLACIRDDADSEEENDDDEDAD